jgi:GGDEF domain-containing protein
MPKRPPTARRRPRPAAVSELTALAEELRGLSPDPEPDGPRLGIFRVLSGLDAADWSRLAKRLKLTGWLALPLDGREAHDAREALLAALADLAPQPAVPEPLTLLPGPDDLARVLAVELERSRYNDSSLSLAVLEVEDVAGIDAAHGAELALEVIAALAEELLHSARSFDLAARVGHGRFALVLPGLGPFRAREAVLAVQAGFRTRRFGAGGIEAWCCAGLACGRGISAPQAQRLLDQAAKALDEARLAGPGALRLCEPASSSFAARTLVHALEKQFLFARKDNRKGRP